MLGPTRDRGRADAPPGLSHGCRLPLVQTRVAPPRPGWPGGVMAEGGGEGWEGCGCTEVE